MLFKLLSRCLVHASLGYNLVEKSFANCPLDTTVPRPSKPNRRQVLVLISHFLDQTSPSAPSRLLLFEANIRNISQLAAKNDLAVGVITNIAQATSDFLSGVDFLFKENRLELKSGVTFEVPQIGEVAVLPWIPKWPRRHGFYLTWAHIPLARKALLSMGFTHVVYLEDDMTFGDANLDYWDKQRARLACLGMLPGYVRYEMYNQERYVVDQVTKTCVPLETVLRSVDVSLCNPYQGMYVLDAALAPEHFKCAPARDSWRSRAIGWGVRERAAAGPIFTLKGRSLVARTVVPFEVSGGTMRINEGALVEHLAGNYSRNPNSPFGKLREHEIVGPC